MATNIKYGVFLLVLSLFCAACEQPRESIVLPTDELEIESFSVNGTEAIKDSALNSLYVIMPAGTDLTALAPEIVITDGATVVPASGETVDFSHKTVNYRVSYGNVYRDYIVKVIKETGSKIGFIGWEDAPSSTNAEIAWAWMQQQYSGNAEYVSLWDLQTGVKDIYDYCMLWYYTDAWDGSWDLPFRAKEPPLVAFMKEYLENGGNLLLTGFSSQWVTTLDITADGKPVNNIYGHENKLLSTAEGIAPASSGHPLFAGLQTDENGVIPLMSAETINNNTAVWYLKDWGGYDNSLAVWRDATGGMELATDIVDGDAIRVTAAEFAPNSERRGRVLTIGVGTYEWLRSGNDYDANIKQLTINAIEYLRK